MDLDTAHGSLELRIEASHSLANAPGERDRTADTDEHTAPAATIERRIDDGGKVFGKFGASRAERDTWGKVHSIKRFARRAGVEY